jgi:hypothetical protein
MIRVNKSSNTQVLFTFGLFYGIRGIIQNIFTFRFPLGNTWPYPGIPSLLVPYGDQSDFYFSGHCGYMTILLLELRRLGYGKKFTFLALVSLAYVAFVLLAFRVHYSIGKFIVFDL